MHLYFKLDRYVPSSRSLWSLVSPFCFNQLWNLLLIFLISSLTRNSWGTSTLTSLYDPLQSHFDFPEVWSLLQLHRVSYLAVFNLLLQVRKLSPGREPRSLWDNALFPFLLYHSLVLSPMKNLHSCFMPHVLCLVIYSIMTRSRSFSHFISFDT